MTCCKTDVVRHNMLLRQLQRESKEKACVFTCHGTSLFCFLYVWYTHINSIDT